MIRYICEIGDPITHRFSTAIRSPRDKSNATYPDEFGNNILYPVLLKIPRLNNKISDSISGSVKQPQQNIIIENGDGKYDDVEALGWFNTPIVIKRSDKELATLADFQCIYRGIISYSNPDFKQVKIKTNNLYRSLTQQVTNTFNIDDYPDIPDGNLDNNIPIAYGPELKKVPLFEIDKNDPTKYIAIDPVYLTGVADVYDSDGVPIFFSVSFGIITATDAATALVSGVSGNTIGDIITSEITVKSPITFDSDNWDLTETNEYSISSGNLNFYFPGGTVRQLVDAVLKSDNAFLFTKNDGRLTIRQWGRVYKVHKLQAWKLMKNPGKDYVDAIRYYNSLALVRYQKNIESGKHELQQSSGISPQFDKEEKKDYPTDLYMTGQVIDLADRMIKRFGIVSEVIKISSGESAAEIDLLDIVELDVNINGRQFSNKIEWVVRESDPGQDVLSLEARSGFIDPEVISGNLSQPQTGNFSGVLSQPQTEDFSGVLSQTLTIIE
jgi:hypothetical protein